jgi:dolichyl-phosphate beta-glucosyltransferase
VTTAAPTLGNREGGRQPTWSVVIPAFNEATRLPPYLDAVVAELESRGEPWEVIVVDDGSADGTSAVVERLAPRHPGLRILRFEDNHGKGAAVRAGMLVATGAYRLFADADGATPIAELKRLEAALGAGADIAIGSRAMRDPGVSRVTRRHRVLAGRFFNWLVARLGLSGISDSQCGFKLFRGEVARRLFGALETDGFGFDVELLLRAQHAGDRIAEVAVNWADQTGSKVGVLKDGPRMVAQIVRASRAVGRARRSTRAPSEGRR